MPRLLIKGTEAAMATASGSASTFGNATVVRVVNTATNADHLVTVAESNSGISTIGTFTILADTTELLEKKPTDVVFVNAGTDVLGAKVGFTN